MSKTMAEENKSVRGDLERRRAQFAWNKVSPLPQALKKEYRTTVRKFPALMHNNGLAQAIAFLLAQGTSADGERIDEMKAPGQLYLHLQQWVCEERNLLSDDLMQGLIASDGHRFRHVTTKIFAITTWLKQFAEALAPEDKRQST